VWKSILRGVSYSKFRKINLSNGHWVTSWFVISTSTATCAAASANRTKNITTAALTSGGFGFSCRAVCLMWPHKYQPRRHVPTRPYQPRQLTLEKCSRVSVLSWRYLASTSSTNRSPSSSNHNHVSHALAGRQDNIKLPVPWTLPDSSPVASAFSLSFHRFIRSNARYNRSSLSLRSFRARRTAYLPVASMRYSSSAQNPTCSPRCSSSISCSLWRDSRVSSFGPNTSFVETAVCGLVPGVAFALPNRRRLAFRKRKSRS